MMVLCLWIVCVAGSVGASPLIYPTGVTVHKPDKVFNGYTLFLAMRTKHVFLVNMEGNIRHSWQTRRIPKAEYAELLPNNHILVGRAPLTEYGWKGNEVWKLEDPEIHHDFFRLANSNTLVVSGQRVVDPNISDKEILDDVIYEITPEKEKVWLWHNRQHVDELDLTDEMREGIRRRGGDWAHMNSMEPLPENPHQDDPRFRPGNIIVDYRLLNTIAIIDRDTGRIVWRLGPDYSKHPGIDQIIAQHNAYMIPEGLPGAGNILIFDNGGISLYDQLSRFSSRVVEIDPVKMETVWAHPKERENVQFYSRHISGVQRLPNGNTLITEGMNGRVFEVTQAGEIVWEFINPFGKGPHQPGTGSPIFRATRYAPDYIKKEFSPSEKDQQVNELLSNIREHTAASIETMGNIQTIYPKPKQQGRAGKRPRAPKGKAKTKGK